jgi:hypothetical protein
MWVAFEMDIGGTELAALYGPFDTEHDAEVYRRRTGLDGVMEIEPPEKGD